MPAVFAILVLAIAFLVCFLIAVSRDPGTVTMSRCQSAWMWPGKQDQGPLGTHRKAA